MFVEQATIRLLPRESRRDGMFAAVREVGLKHAVPPGLRSIFILNLSATHISFLRNFQGTFHVLQRFNLTQIQHIELPRRGVRRFHRYCFLGKVSNDLIPIS